ncbi:MAG: hypothetical protein H7263_18915, partial [Candidatus Sericytochromatia bacterium]|nr:hypothetical protein [Candidatus Sericytochromatia bacterium]
MNNLTLFNSVEPSYKAVTLKFFYDKYLYQFDYKRKALGSDKPKLDKFYLTELLTYVFDNEKIFKELINVLPPIVEKILQVIIFEDIEISTAYLEKRYGMEIVRKGTTHYNDEYKKIDPAFFLFSIKSKENNYREPDYILSLPKIIRYRLKTYYPVPEEYMLTPIEQIDKISYFYENNNSILDDLPMYKKFLEHEKLAFSSQDRPLKGALKATKDVCEIQEFYNSSDLKDVEYTRTELIISFLMYELSTNKTTKEPVKGLEYLKKIFNNYESGRSFYTFVLLYHIKRLRPVIEYSRYNYFEMNQTFNKNIFKVLKSLKVEQWFSFENVYKFITYNEFDFDLINDRDARDTYLNSKFERVYDDKIYIKEKVIYQEAIIKPAIKASFFLLASFGIIDIAYNLPKNKIEQKGKNYLSIFDGLEY